MKVLSVFIFTCLSAIWAQTSATQPLPPPAPAAVPTIPDLPDDTVVAALDDGTKFTMGDFKKIYAALPPDAQQMALRDRKMFLDWWSGMRKMAGMAEKQKLDEESPTKESLEYARIQILAAAKMNEVLKTGTVEPAEVLKYYNEHKEQYKVVKVKAIYITYSDDPPGTTTKGKKPLTEAQAKAKATKLLTEIRGGADFVKLVKENSDDETSRAKDGEFLTLRINDNVPEAVRTAVFALKKGEVTEPVKQQGGFYLLRAEDVSYRPFSQVRDDIFTELKQKHYQEWVEKMNKENKVQLLSPEFLGLKPLAMPGK
jgi:peptidyl-prolyl cis-trans isomerase C